MYENQDQIKESVYDSIKSRGQYSQRKLISFYCNDVLLSAKDIRKAIKDLINEGKIVKGDYYDNFGRKTDDLICVDTTE